jgi:2'-5' RNA ligase
VIWVGLKAPPELNRLQRKVEAAASLLGYAPEDKPFSPHLTIGRVREQGSPDELNRLQEALAGLEIGELGRFATRAVTLFKSELQPSGPIYTPLFSAHMGSNTEKEII